MNIALDYKNILFGLQPKYSKIISDILIDYARDGHRDEPGEHYVNRTGTLRRATKTKGTLADEIKLYADTSVADYAKVIHSGDWNNGGGDEFITDTVVAKREEITAIVEDMYNEATEILNRRG